MMHAHFLHQIPCFHVTVGEKHNAHQHRQQEDMHHVEHPRPAQDLHAGDQKAFARQDFAVRQHRRKTCQKHENLGRIAETEVTQGDLPQRVVGHVIPKDEDQCQATKKVDPVIAR